MLYLFSTQTLRTCNLSGISRIIIMRREGKTTTTTIFGMCLPSQLLKAVDEKRKDIPRSKYFQRLAERDIAIAVEKEEQKKGVEGSVVTNPSPTTPTPTPKPTTDFPNPNGGPRS
jgi:hypothetical protein